MSSPPREPLTGTIRQGKKIVGGVCLPEEKTQLFIDQFNHCYGAVGLKIDQPHQLRMDATRKIYPVGAGLFNPFRSQVKPPSEFPPPSAPNKPTSPSAE